MCNGLFKMKWHLPRLYRKLSVAHFRTKLSLSRVAQRVSLGYCFLLIQAIGCSLPSLACSNTTSSPVPEASTWTLNSFPKLGLTSTGSLTKPFAGCLMPPSPLHTLLVNLRWHILLGFVRPVRCLAVVGKMTDESPVSVSQSQEGIHLFFFISAPGTFLIACFVLFFST